MKIGKLDKRIELFKPVSSEDGYGGLSTDYESAGFIWAQVVQTNYAEQQAQGTPMNRDSSDLESDRTRNKKRMASFPFGGNLRSRDCR